VSQPPVQHLELVPVPTYGRVFGQVMRPGLADCAPSGRMRLDSIARWMQDIAYADVDDAGVAGHAFWILRRTRIRVIRFPEINEPHLVRTFCSGVGRLVAERRTVIASMDDPDRADVETASMWVHLDPVSHRPSRITQEEFDKLANNGYGERPVSHRLTHPRPEPGSGVKLLDWRFRRVDTDVADHVNNTVYWEPLEEELLATAPTASGGAPAAPTPVDAELEFRDGAQPGVAHWMADGPDVRFIVDDAQELLATMALLTPLGGEPPRA
jgi:acyl-ACP thioesterase